MSITKFARVDQDGIVREIIMAEDPTKLYTAEVAAMFVPCPAQVDQHWVKVGANWLTPQPSPNHILVGGAWVLDQVKVDAENAEKQLSTIKSRLQIADVRNKLNSATTIQQVKQVILDVLPDIVDLLRK